MNSADSREPRISEFPQLSQHGTDVLSDPALLVNVGQPQICKSMYPFQSFFDILLVNTVQTLQTNDIVGSHHQHNRYPSAPAPE